MGFFFRALPIAPSLPLQHHARPNEDHHQPDDRQQDRFEPKADDPETPVDDMDVVKLFEEDQGARARWMVDVLQYPVEGERAVDGIVIK